MKYDYVEVHLVGMHLFRFKMKVRGNLVISNGDISLGDIVFSDGDLN